MIPHPAVPLGTLPIIAQIIHHPIPCPIIQQPRRTCLIAIIGTDLAIRGTLIPAKVAANVAVPAVVELAGTVILKTFSEDVLCELVRGETFVVFACGALGPVAAAGGVGERDGTGSGDEGEAFAWC